MYEIRCPFLPLGHFTATGATIDAAALRLAMHCVQNHRNDPDDTWPEEARQAYAEVEESVQKIT